MSPGGRRWRAWGSLEGLRVRRVCSEVLGSQAEALGAHQGAALPGDPQAGCGPDQGVAGGSRGRTEAVST